jgi:ZIP family zinc transporter
MGCAAGPGRRGRLHRRQRLLERHGGGKRKDPSGAQAEGSPMAIVLGSVLDGIPESFVLGFTVLQGG